TIADAVVYETEGAIASHLTTVLLPSDRTPKVANVRAAIRRLRKALEPFTRGWVDGETADIVPAALDAKLAARDQELTKLRSPSAQRRALAMLCQSIEVLVRQFASAKGERISKEDTLRYIDAALNFAQIEHPSLSKHRDRLAALVFPPD